MGEARLGSENGHDIVPGEEVFEQGERLKDAVETFVISREALAEFIYQGSRFKFNYDPRQDIKVTLFPQTPIPVETWTDRIRRPGEWPQLGPLAIEDTVEPIELVGFEIGAVDEETGQIYISGRTHSQGRKSEYRVVHFGLRDHKIAVEMLDDATIEETEPEDTAVESTEP